MSDESTPAPGWRTASYTRPLMTLTFVMLGFGVHRDLTRGARYIAAALDLESTGWSSAWVLAAWLVAYLLSTEIALRLYLYKTVKVHQAKPLEPQESGVLDMAFWGSTIALLLMLGACVVIDRGPLAWVRPVMVVVLTAVTASIVAGKLAFVVANAVHGPSVLRKGITRKQCEKRYGESRRCPNWTFRGQAMCRWHLIGLSTAQRYGGKERYRGLLQRLGALCFAAGAVSLMHYWQTTEFVWLMLGLAGCGVGARLVAEGVIVPYATLSQFPIWPELFAFGVALQASGALALMIAALAAPEWVQPIAAFISGNPSWLQYNQAAVYVTAAAVMLNGWNALLSRVLFYDVGGIGALVPVAFLPLFTILQEPINRWAEDERWSQILDRDPALVLGFALFSAYATAGLLVRNRPRTRALQSPDPFIRSVLALLGLAAARSLMEFTGMMGTVPFVAATAACSAVFGFIAVAAQDRLKIART